MLSYTLSTLFLAFTHVRAEDKHLSTHLDACTCGERRTVNGRCRGGEKKHFVRVCVCVCMCVCVCHSPPGPPPTEAVFNFMAAWGLLFLPVMLTENKSKQARNAHHTVHSSALRSCTRSRCAGTLARPSRPRYLSPDVARFIALRCFRWRGLLLLVACPPHSWCVPMCVCVYDLLCAQVKNGFSWWLGVMFLTNVSHCPVPPVSATIVCSGTVPTCLYVGERNWFICACVYTPTSLFSQPPMACTILTVTDST